MPFSSGPISVTTYKAVASGGAAVKTFIQGNIHQNGAASSTTVAVSLVSTVGNGNAVCVAVGSAFSGAGDSITVSDDKGNSYTAVDTGFNSNAGYSLYTFFRLNITNAPQTITATDNTQARTFFTIMADEFSGLVNAPVLDGHNIQAQSNPGSAADAVSSGTYTTTKNGDIVWGVAVSTTSQGMSTGTGFTVGGSNNVASTFATEWKVQSSASASTAATFTDGSATDQTIAASIALSG